MLKATHVLPCLVVLLLACPEKTPDRHSSPEAALIAARVALHRHDLPAYFDALSDDQVLLTLKNSIGICQRANDPAMKEALESAGLKPSVGCKDILRKHGWVEPEPTEGPEATTRAWKDALKSVGHPRLFAAELEENHRRAGAGSSFVWEYLDGIELGAIAIVGDTATATVSWHGERQLVGFERDVSGWRFTPNLGLIKINRQLAPD